jgi:hypothetical protein
MNVLTSNTKQEIAKTQDLAAAYRDIGDQAGSGEDFLKFKRGKFVKGADDQEVAHGMRFAANMRDLQMGFIKFVPETPPEKAMARPGQPRVQREALGDTDEALWEKDDNGVAKDPWTPAWELPIKDVATGEELVFSSSSAGGINALGRLSKAYGNRLAMAGHAVPIVELGASSYRHKRFGDVDVPVLQVVSWQIEEDLIAGKAADDLDDQIPF